MRESKLFVCCYLTCRWTLLGGHSHGIFFAIEHHRTHRRGLISNCWTNRWSLLSFSIVLFQYWNLNPRPLYISGKYTATKPFLQPVQVPKLCWDLWQVAQGCPSSSRVLVVVDKMVNKAMCRRWQRHQARTWASLRRRTEDAIVKMVLYGVLKDGKRLAGKRRGERIVSRARHLY